MEELRKGDLVVVRCVDEFDESFGIEVGSIGVLVDVNDNDLPTIQFRDDNKHPLYRRQFEVLGDSSKFTLGDKVRLVELDELDEMLGLGYGMEGRVVDIAADNLPLIDFGMDHCLCMYDDQLELICNNDCSEDDTGDELVEAIDAIVELWSELDDIGVGEDTILELILNLIK